MILVPLVESISAQFALWRHSVLIAVSGMNFSMQIRNAAIHVQVPARRVADDVRTAALVLTLFAHLVQTTRPVTSVRLALNVERSYTASAA
jgi:hypothetical protein